MSIHEVSQSVLIQLQFDPKDILTNINPGKRDAVTFSERAALHWLCFLLCHIFAGTAPTCWPGPWPCLQPHCTSRHADPFWAHLGPYLQPIGCLYMNLAPRKACLGWGNISGDFSCWTFFLLFSDYRRSKGLGTSLSKPPLDLLQSLECFSHSGKSWSITERLKKTLNPNPLCLTLYDLLSRQPLMCGSCRLAVLG